MGAPSGPLLPRDPLLEKRLAESRELMQRSYARCEQAKRTVQDSEMMRRIAADVGKPRKR
jgi:hypothetical protein